MALFKYFKVDKCVKEDNAVLPNPSGPLARTIPPSQIDAINDDIKPVVDRQHEARMKIFLRMRRHG